jgi:predicted MFS family arabinose efflux permease
MLLQVVLGYTSDASGIRLLPTTFAGGLGGIIGGIILNRTSKYYLLLILSLILVLPSYVIFATLNPNSPFMDFQTYIASIPLALGYSSFINAVYVAMLRWVESDEMAMATGMFTLTRSLGQNFGLAIASGVQQKVLETELEKRIQGPDASNVSQLIKK